MFTSPSKRTTALTAIALSGAAAFVGPVNATDLFVAGTIGEVYVGDSEIGGFEPLGGACLGSIQALAMDGP